MFETIALSRGSRCRLAGPPAGRRRRGRQRLASGTQNVRGLRLLDDNFYGVPQAIAVPLDRMDRLQLVNAALHELRANGFLADSVARSGVEGLTVAPAEMPSR